MRTYVLQGHLSNGERSDMAHVYILCGSHNRQGSLWTTELWEYAVREVCQPVEAGRKRHGAEPKDGGEIRIPGGCPCQRRKEGGEPWCERS